MGLIAHYRLDGDATDALGQFDATPSNITWVDGKLGKAGSFATSYLKVNNHPVRETGEFSLAFWVAPGSTAVACFFCARTVLGQGLSVFRLTGGTIRFDFGNQWTTSVSLDTDQWNHIVLTRFGNTKSIYKNGVFQGSTTFGEVTDFNPALATIGCSQVNGSTYGNYFDGLLDDYRIYDHALSKREVKDLAKGLVFHLEANETGPKDKSLQANSLINNGATYVDSAPIGKGAYTFNNANIDCGSAFHTTLDQTISIWVKPYSFYARQNFYNRNYGGEGTITLEPSNYLSYYWGTHGGNASPYQSFSSTGGITLNEWNHVVLVRKLGVGGYLKWYINGIERGSSTPAYAESALSVSPLILGDGYTSPFDGQICDFRQYATALSADEVNELYQQRASLDAQGNFYAGLINDTGIKQPLLLNWTQWQDGQTGHVGMFPLNGSSNESYRVIDTDPWGKPTVVWEARPDATSGADGGWNADYVPVDPTKTYRFSTWVRRPVTGNGTFYLGCNGSPAVLNRSNGAANSNPYFDYRGELSSEWMLVVGHIWPEGSGIGSVHQDSGRYTISSGRIGGIVGDYVFADGTTSCRHRSYLYYSTDVNTRQQWCYPRMDVCDGTEPSIAELLAGFDSRNEDLLRANNGQVPKLSINAVTSGNFSELGITDGLVAYYPLTKDAKDYSGNGYDGVVDGAVPVGGGFDGRGAYRFDGANSNYIRVSGQTINGGSWIYPEATFTFWINPNIPINSTDQNIITIENTFEIAINNQGSASSLKYASTPWAWRTASGKPINTGEWHFVAYVHSLAYRKLYVDGVEIYNSVETGGLSSGSSSYPYLTIGGRYSGTAASFNGDICNMKIFNRALTPEEVAIEYKRSGPAKMTQHNGTTFIQGEFKEVTA